MEVGFKMVESEEANPKVLVPVANRKSQCQNRLRRRQCSKRCLWRYF
jgi:hypothetical protein